MSNIYCSVQNCHYWKKGNVCAANEIMVTSDKIGDSALDSYDAPDHMDFKSTPANSCMDTCCKTFVEKGSKNFNEDGVMKQ